MFLNEGKHKTDAVHVRLTEKTAIRGICRFCHILRKKQKHL